VDSSNVEPRKDDTKIVALIGVCEGGADEWARPDTPPKIGGRLRKHCERWGFCGSPKMFDLLCECVQRVVIVR
jgi:hypothetical protein